MNNIDNAMTNLFMVRFLQDFKDVTIKSTDQTGYTFTVDGKTFYGGHLCVAEAVQEAYLFFAAYKKVDELIKTNQIQISVK